MVIKESGERFLTPNDSQNNAMRAFTTLMESRATRRGNQVTVKEKNKSDLKPRDVMRIIVKNYYRKDRMSILLECLETLQKYFQRNINVNFC